MARSPARSGVDRSSSCVMAWPASTSRASAASPPRMASAIACGSIPCWTSWWTMSRRRMLSRIVPGGTLEHPVHLVGDRGQAPLQRRDAGAARREPQPDPPERELAVQVPGGGRRGQHGVVHLVELVPEHRGKVHDPGDDERRPPGRDRRVRRQVRAVELIGHVAAHAGVEELGLARRQRDLVGGAGPGQPARQHRHPVLPEALAVEAASQAVGEPGVVDLAVYDRIGIQADDGGGGGHPGQALDLPDDRQDRAGHVDEHVAGVDRVQVAPVGRVGAPGAGQGPQRDRAEQAADQRHHHHLAPRAPPGAPPVVEGRAHGSVTSAPMAVTRPAGPARCAAGPRAAPARRPAGSQPGAPAAQ